MMPVQDFAYNDESLLLASSRPVISAGVVAAFKQRRALNVINLRAAWWREKQLGRCRQGCAAQHPGSCGRSARTHPQHHCRESPGARKYASLLSHAPSLPGQQGTSQDLPGLCARLACKNFPLPQHQLTGAALLEGSSCRSSCKIWCLMRGMTQPCPRLPSSFAAVCRRAGGEKGDGGSWCGAAASRPAQPRRVHLLGQRCSYAMRMLHLLEGR